MGESTELSEMSTTGVLFQALHKEYVQVLEQHALFKKSSADETASDNEEEFEIVSINDFTSEEIKAESQHYDDTGSLPSVPVCPGYHGGPLDYPKLATATAAKVTEKWDICFDRLELVIRHREKGWVSLTREQTHFMLRNSIVLITYILENNSINFLNLNY